MDRDTATGLAAALTRQSRPDEPLGVSGAGRAVVDAALASPGRGGHAVMVWPGGFAEIGAAFGAAAVEAQALGEAGFRAVLFPWRNSGQVRTMRSLMVDETPLVAFARRRATEGMATGGSLAAYGKGLAAYDLLTLRLGDLGKATGRMRGRKRERNLAAEVRHPTLADLFPVFEPREGGRPGYANAGGGFLARVRDYTDIPTMIGDARFAERSGIVGDPAHAPFALFGVPGGKTAEWTAWLDAWTGDAPRTVFLDATEAGRKALGSRWRDQAVRFAAEAERRWPGVGVVAVTDAPEHLRSLLRATVKGRDGEEVRPFTQRTVVLSGGNGLTAADGAPARGDGATEWTVALKDKSVMNLVHEGFNLMNALYAAKYREAGNAVYKLAMNALLLTNMPCGWEHLVASLAEQYDGAIPEIISERLLPTRALATVSEAAKADPEHGERMRRFVAEVQRHLGNLKRSTPISNSLRRLVADIARGDDDRKVAFCFRNRETEDVFQNVFVGSLIPEVRERVEGRLLTAGRHDLALRLARGEAAGWGAAVMVNPDPDDIGLLLAAPALPGRVMLVSDASNASDLVRKLDDLAKVSRGQPWGGNVVSLRDILAADIDALPDLKSLFDAAAAPEPPRGPTRVVTSGRSDVSLFTDAGTEFRCGASATVLVHTDDAGTPFRRVRADAVEEGDRILVPSEDIPPTLRAVLRTLEPDAAERRAALDEYHAAVLRGLVGLPRTFRHREGVVLTRMRATLPDLPDTEEANIRRWIAVRPGQDRPDAPRDRDRFEAFGNALGMAAPDIARFWSSAVVPWRDLRRENGFELYHRAIGFLSDPDSASVRLSLGAAEHDAIMREVTARMETVVRSRDLAPTVDDDLEDAPAPVRALG